MGGGGDKKQLMNNKTGNDLYPDTESLTTQKVWFIFLKKFFLGLLIHKPSANEGSIKSPSEDFQMELILIQQENYQNPITLFSLETGISLQLSFYDIIYLKIKVYLY